MSANLQAVFTIYNGPYSTYFGYYTLFFNNLLFSLASVFTRTMQKDGFSRVTQLM